LLQIGDKKLRNKSQLRAHNSDRIFNGSAKPELSSAFEVVNIENIFADLPLYRKIADLSLTVILELKHNPLLIALIFGASITRLISILFSTFLILWI